VAIPPATPDWLLEAEEFSLFESTYARGRTRYRCLQTWPLAEVSAS